MNIVIKCLLITTIAVMTLYPSSAMTSEEEGLWPAPEYRYGNLAEKEFLILWGDDIRKNWSENGFTASLSNITTFQSVIDGGKDQGEELGGSLDYEIHLDFQKMGLWPGAFVRLYGETQYGNFINSKTGAALAANVDGLLPLVDKDTTTLTGAIFYQFLHENFGLFFGKIDTLDGDFNEFAHGRGNDQFLNQNFVFNPVTLRTTPVAAFGGGAIIILPGENNTFIASVLDPSGQPDEWDLGDAFDDGTLVTAEMRLEVKPFNFKGNQLVGATYSTKSYTSLTQNRRLLILELVSTGGITLAEEDDSWSFYYNFDQYVYTEESDPEQGVGFFGRFGIADDKTSPIDQFFSIGVGGKGIIPGRDKDTFGIGYFYVGLSDKLPSVFNVLDDGQGAEFFYNIEVTPWLHATPDFQIIEPSLQSFDTAYVAGVRVRIDF